MPANHPVKLIKQLAGAAFKELSPRFEQMYSEVGRPSIPPERLLKASLFDGAVHVRSERMFREQLDYNLFFCWPWILTGTSRASPPSFSRIRRRLLGHEVAGEFFRTVAAEAREPKLTATSTFL